MNRRTFPRRKYIMKKILAALVLASFLGAGLACAQGTDAAAPKPTPTKKVAKHVHHKGHKKAVAKATPAPEAAK
jgi:hypothetical protein